MRVNKKRNHHGGHDHFLLNCTISWKEHIADLERIAARFLQTLSQECFSSKLGFYPKYKLENLLKTFKTSQVNESRLSICWLNSEQNYWEKEVPEIGTFYGWCFKHNDRYIFQCWDLVIVFPPIKIPGYAPGCTNSLRLKFWVAIARKY